LNVIIGQRKKVFGSLIWWCVFCGWPVLNKWWCTSYQSDQCNTDLQYIISAKSPSSF